MNSEKNTDPKAIEALALSLIEQVRQICAEKNEKRLAGSQARETTGGKEV